MDKMHTRIVLNVGGTRFETTIGTLSSVPNTYFEVLFKRWTDEGDLLGEIFIDRDPTLFRHILNILRTRKVPAEINQAAWNDLKTEIEFYNIPQLILSKPPIEIDLNIVKGELVSLTELAIIDFGLVVGAYPSEHNGPSEWKASDVNVFTEERCPYCDKFLSPGWQCMLQENYRFKGSQLDVETVSKRRNHLAQRSRFRVEELDEQCAVIGRVFPKTAPNVPRLHLPRELLRKAIDPLPSSVANPK